MKKRNNSFSGKARVSKVCQLYNISEYTLYSFLNSKGYRKDLNLNSELDEKALDLISKEFVADKLAKDKRRGPTKAEFVKMNEHSNSEDRKANEIENLSYHYPVLHLHKNIFASVKKEIRLRRYPLQQSHFTDTEAINICSRMTSPFTRQLCRQLDKPHINLPLIMYQLHYIANTALNLFGGKLLTFIGSLRKLQFKNKGANEIKTYRKVIPDFPILTFKTQDTEFKISFFLKQIRSKKNFNLKPDIRLFAAKSFEEIGSIDEEGYVLTRLQKFKPQLSLFHEATKNNNFKIYSGVETGKCEICGLPLTVPTSLRIGLGPICARNQKIDSSLYQFA